MNKILTLLCVLCSTLGYTQDAKSLLDKVADKVRSYENIYIEFEHKFDNEEANMHQTTTGNASLQGDLYRFNYMGLEQLFDGTKVYLIVHEDLEVVIKQPNSEDITTLTPSRMMTFYENGFDYEMDITQTINGQKMQLVKLIPQSEETELQYVLVTINTSNNHIHKVLEIGLDGTKTSYTITKFETNQSLPADFFQFDEAAYLAEDYTITEPK